LVRVENIMTETIKDVLIRRDNMSPKEADNLILAARIQLDHYLIENDLDAADNICMEYFNLEPDYIMDLI